MDISQINWKTGSVSNDNVAERPVVDISQANWKTGSVFDDWSKE